MKIKKSKKLALCVSNVPVLGSVYLDQKFAILPMTLPYTHAH